MPLPRPIRYPSPVRSTTPPANQGPTDAGGSAQVPPTNVNVAFPPPNPPIMVAVIGPNSVRSKAVIVSDPFFWPRAGPLSVRVENGLDQTVRVRLFVSHDRSTNPSGAKSPLEFDVGAGQNETDSLDPLKDVWAQYVWAEAEPQGTPTMGVLTVEFGRIGDL